MKKRMTAYAIIGFAYILACGIAWFVFTLISDGATNTLDIILRIFVADVIATIIIWIFGLLFRNSSFYDAYWSLVPWLIILALMVHYELFNINNILLLTVFGIWSFRLTINWMYTCDNIKCEDWRYTNYRANNKKVIWHIINLFGINLMPTVLVFLALIPGIIFIFNTGKNFMPMMTIGCIIILSGTLIEFFADNSMHKFRKLHKGKGMVIDTGLWKYSRHPNYLGEILIWIGLTITLLFIYPEYWMWSIGAVMIILLFVFISIPLAEKRQLSRRRNYHEYKQQTSMLMLLPRKKKKI